MAPPAKRRRISDDESGQSAVDARPSNAYFSHGVEHIEATPTVRSLHTPSRIDEVHLEIRKRAANGNAKLHPRQGTAASSDTTTSSADVIVSVVASVDADGSTTSVSTASVTSDTANLPSYPATSTTTSVVSDGDATTSDAASSTDESETSTESSASPSSTPESSATSSTGSTEDAGITPAATGGTAPTAGASSIISDSSATNSSMTTSSDPLIAGTVSGYTAQTVMSTANNRMNLTTSATTISASDSTFTSQSTFDLASLTSSDASQSTQTSSMNSTLGAGVVFLATLDDGSVATITRSDEPYSTTLDGTLTTISPSSSDSDSSTTSSSTRTSSSSDDDDDLRTTSAITTISTGPSEARSTIFSTYTPSYTTTNAAGSTVTEAVGAAGVIPDATSDPPSSSTTAASSNNSSDDTPPAGTIAGGVVGGAAGLAVVLLVAMLFLRWWRRRASTSHQALPPNAAGLSPDPDSGATAAGSSRSEPGMAERAGLMPFAGAMPAFLRHQKSHPSTASGSERGFTRVSGRKLPSAFSEGMVASSGPYAPGQYAPGSPAPGSEMESAVGSNGTRSPPPTMPLVPERNMSEMSFYRDSQGFYYGGDGSDNPQQPYSSAQPGPYNSANAQAYASRPNASANPFSDLSPLDTDPSPHGSDGSGGAFVGGEGGGRPIISPGPQRRPTVHQGGPYVMSPKTAGGKDGGMLSPASWRGERGSGGGFGGHEEGRGSRFMEEV